MKIVIHHADAVVKNIFHNCTKGSGWWQAALLKEFLPEKLNLTMESENESTAKGTKIRAILKWLNWDRANEKFLSVRNLPVIALRKLMCRDTCCWQGKLGSSWQWQPLLKFTIDGLLVNNKRKNNSGNLYSHESFLSLYKVTQAQNTLTQHDCWEPEGRSWESLLENRQPSKIRSCKWRYLTQRWGKGIAVFSLWQV